MRWEWAVVCCWEVGTGNSVRLRPRTEKCTQCLIARVKDTSAAILPRGSLTEMQRMKSCALYFIVYMVSIKHFYNVFTYCSPAFFRSGSPPFLTSRPFFFFPVNALLLSAVFLPSLTVLCSFLKSPNFVVSILNSLLLTYCTSPCRIWKCYVKPHSQRTTPSSQKSKLTAHRPEPKWEANICINLQEKY